MESPGADTVVKNSLLQWTIGPIAQQYGEGITTFQERGLAVFEAAGIIRHDEQGNNIVNLAKLTGTVDYDSLRYKLGKRKITDERGTRRQYPDKLSAFYEVFKDMSVYSEEDYARVQKGESLLPKSLFYIPKDDVAAISPAQIQQADFYVGLWDLETSRVPATYPTVKDGLLSKLSTQEAVTASLIFHPKFGGGVRDEQGRLMVRFKDGSTHPISSDFFTSWGYSGGRGIQDVSIFRPAEFFQTRTPRLVGAGLIDPQKDFTVAQGTKTEAAVGANLRVPTERGLVMVDQVRYTLGAEYDGKKGYAAWKISDKYAAVVKIQPDGTHKLDAIFTLALANHSEKSPAGQKIYPTLGRGQFELKKVAELAGDISEIALVARNFDQFLAFSKQITKEANVSLISLSQTEQTHALGLYIRFKGDKRFWDFITKFKLDGLRSLIIARSSESIEKILPLSQRTDVDRLLKETAAISSAIYSDSSTEELEKGHPGEIIADQANRILSGAEAVVAGRIEGVDMHDITSLMVSYRNAVDRMMSLKGVKGKTDRYQELLRLFERGNDDPTVRATALSLLQRAWTDEIAREVIGGDTRLRDVVKKTEEFYTSSGVYDMATETTGDTEQELLRWDHYDACEPVEGTLVDLGVGSGRLAAHKARRLSERAKVIGVDIIPMQTEGMPDNLLFSQGDLTNIPLPDSSVDAADADWSVVNDAILRRQQATMFLEVARILKEGGRFRLDIPYLEGGEGSWETTAQQYHAAHPETPYGMIVADFPGGAKEFYIYPKAELVAFLEAAGFSIENQSEWRTSAGKPRLTVEARLTNKVNPLSLASGRAFAQTQV